MLGRLGQKRGDKEPRCPLVAEGIGFSWIADVNKEGWHGLLRLRGGKAVNVEPRGSRTQDLGFAGLP